MQQQQKMTYMVRGNTHATCSIQDPCVCVCVVLLEGLLKAPWKDPFSLQ